MAVTMPRLTTLRPFTSLLDETISLRTEMNQLLSDMDIIRSKSTPSDRPKSADLFQVSVSVSDFKAEELNVKVVSGTLIVEGQREEKDPTSGAIRRQTLQKKWILPGDVDPERLTSTFSSEGLLTVSAPKTRRCQSSEKRIEIQRVESNRVQPEKR